VELPMMSKLDAAHKLLDELLEIRRKAQDA